jgi:D-alanine-D-alanine ligase-like ATP-grasp enzyme
VVTQLYFKKSKNKKAMEASLSIFFQTINWQSVEKTIHPGKTGIAYWQTLQFPGLRLRIVEYSAGYGADHWCSKGHIVHCLHGELISEMETGESYTLTAGMTYVVSDHLSSHRSLAKEAVKLLIIDGIF